MARQTFLIYFGLFLLSTISSSVMVSSVSEAAREKQHRRQRLGAVKLFVFGDSYADTGNCPKPSAASWKEPYGFTFPGTPAGRFSDGRVLTDYIASFLGIPPPLPYQWRKDGKSRAAFGMNFAYGGTGVLNTMVKEPNMTTQIDLFQQLLAEEELYTKRDLNSSIAWVSLGGNDYAAYMASSHGDLQGFPNLTKSVINQLALNLKRIHGLGVKKIAVAAIEPLGCLPAITASSSYQNCSEAENSLSKFHNQLLQEAVHKLNNESGLPVPAFEIIDLHAAFTSALATHQQNHHTGTIKFENPLKPCCVGVEKGYSCGNVDESGAKKYVVCEKPFLSFFWDMIHPSQQGWSAVYSALRPSLHHQLY